MEWWIDSVYSQTVRWAAWTSEDEILQREGEEIAVFLAKTVVPHTKLIFGRPGGGATTEGGRYRVFSALQGVVDAWGWLAQPAHWEHQPSEAEIFAEGCERVKMEEKLEGHLCEFAQLLSGRRVRLEALPLPEPSATPANGPTLKVAKLSQDALLPTRATPGSAGLDLYLRDGDLIVLNPGERRLVSTGLQVTVPEGYEGQVRPRSGRAFKDGLTVLNSPGTIDSDYRGELKVLLINHGRRPVIIQPKERIAQFVIAPVTLLTVEEVSPQADSTGRSGGFGSTGS